MDWKIRNGEMKLMTGRRFPAGAFDDAVLADVTHIAAKPAAISFEQAAALPIIGVTALQAITVQSAGQSVFVNGCLGGVGRIATQIALGRGIAVAGSCRASDREDARTLGVSPTVDFDFDATGLKGRFDLVLDTARS